MNSDTSQVISYFHNSINLVPKLRTKGIDEAIKHISNMKSGDLGEFCFEIIFPDMTAQVKYKNYIFDFVDSYGNIYEVKNFLYESNGSAHEKIFWAGFKYVDALKSQGGDYEHIYIILCGKFEHFYERIYRPVLKRFGLLKILNDLGVYYISVSDLITNFYYTENEMSCIKWVGGKSKLLPQIQPKITSFPNTTTYLEPFLGSGSVLLNLLKSTNHTFEKIKVNDINEDLITMFETIKSNPNQLIYSLSKLENRYFASRDKESFYYKYRDLYNDSSFHNNNEKAYYFLGDNDLLDLDDEINLEPTSFHYRLLRSTLFIFLNKTCFRGLYRVNKQNLFNVPFGNYVNPSIVNPDEILGISKLIQNVEFYNKDYKTFLTEFKTDNSVIYLDPPYIGTFNGYSSTDFNHDEFVNMCSILPDKDKNVHVVISNSKPFYDKYETSLKGFDVEMIDIKDRINSRLPNSIRNEVLLTL